MVATPAAASSDPPPKPIISPPNTVSLSQIVTGCKVFVERPVSVDVPVPEVRKAEILSIRERKVGRAERKEKKARLKAAQEGDKAAQKALREEEEEEKSRAEGDRLEYYCHYVEFNKRLDEWVSSNRILLSREVEWPLPPQAPAPTGSARKNSRETSAALPGSPSPAPSSPSGSALENKKAVDAGNVLRKAAIRAAHEQSVGNKRKAVEDDETADEDADGELDADGDADMVDAQTGADGSTQADSVDGDEGNIPTFSKAREIEKLRTQGSMTQSHSEVSRVKNLDRIQIGKHLVEAWYFSPYPVEYAHTPILYVCEFCLSFFASEKQIERHRHKCTLLHPPGNEIYRHEDMSFFEIDGRKQKTWCRNLCLLSKTFLDHKTLYYDVDPFLFYVMCKRDDEGVHLVGYFSKEKESAEAYNLACILTLPQYQRQGYGSLLIEFSYLLSRNENKQGSPEKPLSDLGLISYRAFWCEAIVDLLVNAKEDALSIDDIAVRTCFLHADIINTCQVYGLLKFSKGQHHLVVSPQMLEQHEKNKLKQRRRINPDKLIWRPPVFSRAELRFGF